MKKETGRIAIPALTGEYVSQDDLLAWAREFFLIAIMNVAPAPLHWLRDRIFPRYSDALDVEEIRGNSWQEIKERAVHAFLDVAITDQRNVDRSCRAYQELRASSPGLYDATEELLDWSKRFNLMGKRTPVDEGADPDVQRRARLDSVWPMVAALETLLTWHFGAAGIVQMPGGTPLWRPKNFNFPKEVEVLPPITTIRHDPRAGISPKLLRKLDPNGPPIRQASEENSQGWYVTIEQESAFRLRLRKDFARWLDEYVAKRRAAAKAAGLVKAPGKRDLARFLWTAKFQVNGEFASKIAEDHNVSGEAVSEGVNWVLDLIGLEPRPQTRGRKRGKPSANSRSGRVSKGN